MNAYELADWLDKTIDSEDWGELAKYYKWCKENVAPMLRQQQAEIEALKMGFANSGTSDSELAEVRALANRQILKNKELQAEITKLKLKWQYMYDRANMDSTSEPVAWMSPDGKVSDTEGKLFYIPLYTHPAKEQDDYCKAYWGNNNKFVDVFLPNSETEVIRFWNNTHPVKELTDEEIEQCFADSCSDFKLLENGKTKGIVDIIEVGRAILRKAQEK